MILSNIILDLLVLPSALQLLLSLGTCLCINVTVKSKGMAKMAQYDNITYFQTNAGIVFIILGK